MSVVWKTLNANGKLVAVPFPVNGPAVLVVELIVILEGLDLRLGPGGPVTGILAVKRRKDQWNRCPLTGTA